MQTKRFILEEDNKVRGNVHPEELFHTISYWKDVARQILVLQQQGFDTRMGVIDDHPELKSIIDKHFYYQLYIETEKYNPYLTPTIVLNFIEDFVNYRIWGFAREYGEYFQDINKLQIAFFYSRGDIEPYILIDDEYTKQTIGTLNLTANVYHWTTETAYYNMLDMIKAYPYDISTFTVQTKKYFVPESNYLIKLNGLVKAAFHSDAKTIVTNTGKRAVNVYRLPHPTGSNICPNVISCTSIETSMWNEIVVRPLSIIWGKEIEEQLYAEAYNKVHNIKK